MEAASGHRVLTVRVPCMSYQSIVGRSHVKLALEKLHLPAPHLVGTDDTVIVAAGSRPL